MLIFLEMLSSDEERISFQTVYEDNYLKMYYVALNMLKDKQRAEDAVHNAFLKLAESYSDYMLYSKEKMKSLCVLMTKQKVIDMIRKEKFMDLKDLNECEEEFISEEGKVIDSIIFEEEKSMLNQVLSNLSETSRVILELKYYHEFNNEKIAEILGITKKHVEVRLYRAKEALKKAIKEAGI